MLKLLNKVSKDTFYFLLIGVLILIIILMRSCSPSPTLPEKPIIVTKIDTTYISVPVDRIIKTPPITITIPGDIQYIDKDIDTLAILKDFFAKRVYIDSIKIDTLGFVLVKDTISQNRIISRLTENHLSIPIIKETTTITNPPIYKTQLYYGFDIMGSKTEPINYFGANLLLKTKKDKIYTIGAGISPTGGVSYKFGMDWKIKIR